MEKSLKIEINKKIKNEQIIINKNLYVVFKDKEEKFKSI